MAALSDSPLARVVELRHLRGGDLDLLLDEETQAWRDTLDWDFRGRPAWCADSWKYRRSMATHC